MSPQPAKFHRPKCYRPTEPSCPSHVSLLQVFFKAGLLGVLEELRDERLAKVLTLLQAAARRRIMMLELLKMIEKR